ncbi:winged helix DNA-binding domain-containing protein [Rhodococcus rhodnii]|uniref:Winged helix DNA-binding domain-containing protein n=2 Tax=Rhodococcus rhodnii TaxID=38312 RepID=R7WQ06_9NOCA|nr:winged helix DNA-binding domain-containing protein [Rhodococcus rhodnii]EOM76089.1 hypothetical protein Rrhod_2455 [Rhodococcus rhodnii LMG 5362]TXG91758.1 winged helix DNA-binding domain-containing protein [Rhodococcus rhodnii]
MTAQLSTRALGRATLARQFLLDRTDAPLAEVVERLAGLQAQAPIPPYWALWTRIRRFDPATLSEAIAARDVVRIASLRGTVFAMTVADAAFFRGFVGSLYDAEASGGSGPHAAGLAGIGKQQLAAVARELLSDGPVAASSLKDGLAERFPDRDPVDLLYGVRAALPLVQTPPRGLWGRPGGLTYCELRDWTGVDVHSRPAAEIAVRRYLAAFGPASPADMQAWCGLTGLREVFERMRDDLVVLRTESGGEVFDLPDAPRPGEDVAAPVRILAPFDNLILSHRDRTRLIDPQTRRYLMSRNGTVPATVLVGGRVAGVVNVESATKARAVATVGVFGRMRVRDRDRVAAEARRLLRFRFPDATDRDVRFTEI